MSGSLRRAMLGGVVGRGPVPGSPAGSWGRCRWPVGCLRRGQACSGQVRAAVARAACRLAGWIGPWPGAGAAGCSGLWLQGVSSTCGLGMAYEVSPPWGQAGAPPAAGSGASCCVGRGVPRMLPVEAVLVLPVSVRRGLRVGKGVSVVPAWAWGDVPQAPSFPPRCLEDFPHAPGDVRVVLG